MFEDLLAANRRHAATFAMGGMPAPTVRGFALVTCMDTRIDPLAILGLKPGDAKIIRNAGGRVTPDVLRGLIVATAYLRVTDVAVMHHTGCALRGLTDEDVLAGIPSEQRRNLEGVAFLAMPDPDAALAEDVRAVRAHPGLPATIRVEGWRYDVDTGLVERVIDFSR